MRHSADRLRQMLDEAWQLPTGVARQALVEQIVVAADAQRLTDLSYRARLCATHTYTYGGTPLKALVSFAWCLAEFDRDPVAYADSIATLLWHFKYVLGIARTFPEVRLEQLQDILADMRQRFTLAGYGSHAVYAEEHRLAWHRGDLPAAQRWYDAWCAAPRDELSDCLACDPGEKAEWLAELGRDEEAIALAEPALAGPHCAVQPASLLGTLLPIWLRAGRLAQAKDAHRRLYRGLQPDDLYIGGHLHYCAAVGNLARALEILERHLPALDTPRSPHAAMWFSAYAAALLRRVKRRDMVVYRPAHGDRPAGVAPAAVLGEELATRALAIAARFDARNATTYQTRCITAVLDAAPVTVHPGARARSRRPRRPG